MRKSSQRTNSENNNTENIEDLSMTSKKQINRQIVILKNIEDLRFEKQIYQKLSI